MSLTSKVNAMQCRNNFLSSSKLFFVPFTYFGFCRLLWDSERVSWFLVEAVEAGAAARLEDQAQHLHHGRVGNVI